MNLLAMLACASMCVIQAEPVVNVPVSHYELHIVGEGRVADFLEPVCDFSEHPDLWREESFQVVWYAVGEDGQRSLNPSNAVWFNRACLNHTGEIIDHGVTQERVGCEEKCCEGCALELPERYEECLHAGPGESAL